MKNATTWAAGAAAAVTVVGLGIGVSQTAVAEPTPSPSSSSTAPGEAPREHDGPGERGPGGPGGRGLDAAALAEKLGVSEEQVSTALEEIHADRRAAREDQPDDQGRPGPPSEADREADRAELVDQLAEKLGLPAEQVSTALDELRSEQQSERAARLADRLDQAVQDGTLTQAEADAVTKAVEKGVIGGR